VKPTICEKHETNFTNLCAAFDRGDAILVEGQRVSDGEMVAMICVVHTDGENMTHFTPFAVMINGNPYELYRSPNPDGGFWPTESEEQKCL
jgi:Family of unknown function (DUF6117)